MKRYTTVNDYIEESGKWKDYLIILRQIVLKSELQETIKWGGPVYTYQGKNVVGFGAFKSYVGLWFYQGALLKDDRKVLINAQEGVTKALRQWRFNSLEEIDESTIVSYINEAIQNVTRGKEIKPEKKELIIPAILQQALNGNKELDKAFNAFSLSHQREYANYIAEAKKEETQLKRLEKAIRLIMENTGLNDKYKK